MKRFVSVIRLLVLFCHGAVAAAEVGIPAARQPGTSLDTSVRNEADNAKRLGAEWLIARQQPDGSWGSTKANTVLTPIVWLALKGMDDAVDAVARDRAVVWLDAQPVEENVPVDALLWRLLAITHALPDSSERQTRIQAIIHAAQPSVPDLSAYGDWLWREAVYPSQRTPARSSPNNEAQRQLALIAPDYPLDTQNTETFWYFARLINRYAKGVWMRGTEALDWRNDFAQALINAQRKDPSGGGYWNAKTDDTKIRATAFALLALGEID